MEEVAVGNTFGLNQGEVAVEEEPVGNTLVLNMSLVLVVLVDNIPGSYRRRIVGDLADDIHGGKLGSMMVCLVGMHMGFVVTGIQRELAYEIQQMEVLDSLDIDFGQQEGSVGILAMEGHVIAGVVVEMEAHCLTGMVGLQVVPHFAVAGLIAEGSPLIALVRNPKMAWRGTGASTSMGLS